MGVISKQEFKYGAYVQQTEGEASAADQGGDVAVLEDRSGRITIQNSAKFRINTFVSGTIIALKGKAVAGGYF